MALPWFLELLELPPHADERAVRRAYAVRVKIIDPATDPAAFARLREAYEAARAWVAEDDHDVAVELSPSAVEPTVETDAVEAEAAGDSTAAPAVVAVNPQEEALRLIDWLATRIAYGETSEIQRELEACTARLRLQYIDAPGIFEEVLIDRLARGLLRKRAYVFDLATQHFHWQEIGHLAALGPRGMWIEAVESQRMVWNGIAPIFRANRLSLIEGAEASKGALPEQIVRRWSEVRDDFRRFPSYLGLYLEPTRQQEWASRYDALPAPERQAIEAHPKQRRQGFFSLEWTPRVRGFLVVTITGLVVYLAVSTAELPQTAPTASRTHATSSAVVRAASDLDVTISESPAPGHDKRWIVVTLANRGPVTLYLDKALTPPMTPGTHLARPLFNIFDPHGVSVAFAHRAIPDPPRDPTTAFVRLEPGQTLSKSFDLDFDYKLIPGVTYRISYRQPVTRTILDKGTYVDSNVLTAKAAAPHADRALPPR
jgi:hypothetical protein